MQHTHVKQRKSTIECKGSAKSDGLMIQVKQLNTLDSSKTSYFLLSQGTYFELEKYALYSMNLCRM